MKVFLLTTYDDAWFYGLIIFQPDLWTYYSRDFRVYMEHNGWVSYQINQMWLNVVGSYGLRMIQHHIPIFICRCPVRNAVFYSFFHNCDRCNGKSYYTNLFGIAWKKYLDLRPTIFGCYSKNHLIFAKKWSLFLKKIHGECLEKTLVFFHIINKGI